MGWTNVKTWATGDIVPASDLNTYIRDDSTYLKGQAGVVAIEAAVTVAGSVAATGNVTATSKIGGGTTVPVEGLHSGRAVRASGAIETATDGQWAALDYASGSARLVAFGPAGVIPGFAMYMAGSNNTPIAIPFRITAGGKTGFGTAMLAAPNEVVEVAGGVRWTGAITTASDGSWGAADFGANQVRFLSFGDASNVGKFQWYQSKAGNVSATASMVLDASARLGIGVASPAGRLDVRGTAVGGKVFWDRMGVSGSVEILPAGAVQYVLQAQLCVRTSSGTVGYSNMAALSLPGSATYYSSGATTFVLYLNQDGSVGTKDAAASGITLDIGGFLQWL